MDRSEDGAMDAGGGEGSETASVLPDSAVESEVLDVRRRSANPFLPDLSEFQTVLARIGEVREAGPASEEISVLTQDVSSDGTHLTGGIPGTQNTDLASYSGGQQTRLSVGGLSALGFDPESSFGENNDSDNQSAPGQSVTRSPLGKAAELPGAASMNDICVEEIGVLSCGSLTYEDNGKSESLGVDEDGIHSTHGTPNTTPESQPYVEKNPYAQETKDPAFTGILTAGVGYHVELQSILEPAAKEETRFPGSSKDSRACSPEDKPSVEEVLIADQGFQGTDAWSEIYALTGGIGTCAECPVPGYEETGFSDLTGETEPPDSSANEADQGNEQTGKSRGINALSAGIKLVEYRIGSGTSRSHRNQPLEQEGLETDKHQRANSSFVTASSGSYTDYRLGPEKGVLAQSGFLNSARLEQERDRFQKIIPCHTDGAFRMDTSFTVSEHPSLRTCFLCPFHSAHRDSKNPKPSPFPYLSCLSAPSNVDIFRSSTPVNDSASAIVSEPTICDSPSCSSAVSADSSHCQPATSRSQPEFNPDPSAVDFAADEWANRSLIVRLLASCCCGMGMKLRCFEGDSGNPPYIFLDDFGADKDSFTEKQEELKFFDDNGRFVSVVVEKNLRSIDLTQLLAVKNRVRKDYCWSIVEHWIETGIERALEDHEDVLSVHTQTEGGAKKYIFRRYPNKYDFFTKPEDYFPSDMVDCKTYEPGFMYPETHPEQLEIVLTTAEELPVIFSQVNYRQGLHSSDWIKTFLILKGQKLLMSSRVQVVAKFLRGWRDTPGYRPLEGEPLIDQDDGLRRRSRIGEGNEEELEVLADLKEYEVYTCLNAKNHQQSPTEFGVILRKTEEDDFTNPVVLSFDKGKDRVCWVTAMRLAKYGKQLRENYKAFKNKQESLSTNGNPAPLNESVRSRVAMDFTGKVGRIVDDPTEAKAIAVSEGNAWKKRLRAKAESSSRCGGVAMEAEEDKTHHSQPWYHKNMSREQATALISVHAKYDGVFLVRSSRSQPGGNVLTLKSQEKVLHLPILMVEDPLDKILCYTIDNGTTKFYDICQLVEFYRLNAGPLPTRLSNHLEKLPQVRTPSSSKNHSDHQ